MVATSITETIKGKKALVVDDQKSIRLILNRILTKSGINVIEASGGMEALIEINNNDFDLIFMDLNMPEISGEESIKTIMELHPDARIIVYSAFDDSSAKSRIADLGISAILEKPASSFEIIEVVKRILSEEENLG